MESVQANEDNMLSEETGLCFQTDVYTFFHFERNIFISPFPEQVNGFGHLYKDSKNWLSAK